MSDELMRFRDQLHRMSVFYESQDSTLKALGLSRQLRFLLGTRQTIQDSNTLRCRQLPLHPTHEQIVQLRGKVDARAVRKRFGLGGDWINLYPNKEHHRLHEAMEQIRCEYLGASLWDGVRYNLTAIQTRKTSEDILDTVLDVMRYKLNLFQHTTDSAPLPDRLNKGLDRLSKLCEKPDLFHDQVEIIANLMQTEVDNHIRQFRPNDPKSEAIEEVPSLQLTDERITSDGVVLVNNHPGYSANDNAYKIYDQSDDQVVDAQDLASVDQLQSLRKQLDGEQKKSRVSLVYLASRLAHVLADYQLTDWTREHDEGLFDEEQFDQLIADPLYPNIFRQRSERLNRDTVVCLLIDNSGSMRGRPITVAAMCADMLSRTLERCGVKNEVLGFTTRYWQGGEIRKKWLNQDALDSPGRLNALRHIIYKSSNRSWRSSRLSLAYMLNPDFLKENIDGEALLWANRRLNHCQARRKILIVVSDGAPRDEATLQANGESYLTDHLQSVIHQIERETHVELLAIGVGHDVSKYYKHAIEISNEASLGQTLIDQLSGLFSQSLQRNVQTITSTSVWSGATRNIATL